MEFRGLPRPRGHPPPDWISHPVAPPAYSSAPPTYPADGDENCPPPSYSQTTAMPSTAEDSNSSAPPQGGATVPSAATTTSPTSTRNRETETNANNQIFSQADVHLR